MAIPLTKCKIVKTAAKINMVAAIPSHNEYGKALTMFPKGGNTLRGRVLKTMHDWQMGWEKSKSW